MPTVQSLEFDHSGWRIVPQKNRTRVQTQEWHFLSSQYLDRLTVSFYDNAPLIVRWPHLDELRQDARLRYTPAGVGIVAHDLIAVGNVLTEQILMKYNEEDNIKYQATITLPFVGFSYIISIETYASKREVQEREQKILNELQANGQIKLDSDGNPIGWEYEPYEPSYKPSALYSRLFLYNRSDDKQYDARFPQHPLTRLRKYLESIHGSIRLADDLVRAEPYHYNVTVRGE